MAVLLQNGKRPLISAQFNLALCQPRGDKRQQLLRHRLVNQQRIERIAGARLLRLRVFDYIHRPGKVGAGIDIEMDNADAAGDHGDRGLFFAKLLQFFTTARDDHVHIFVEPQQLGDQRAVGIGNQLDNFRRDADIVKRLVDHLAEGDVAAQGFAAATQDHGVAGFDRQGGNGDVQQVPLVMALLEAGFADHLMFSADASSGYAKTVTNFLPKLKAAGASDQVLHQIMVDNPRRFLAFVPKRPRKH